MITRKEKVVTTTRIWPYTPEPSPPPSPTLIKIAVDNKLNMAEEPSRFRPVSVTSKREGLLSPNGRPTLDDVLNGRAPSPYTLAAYTAFLSQQHCLETLEFVTEAKKYGQKYDEAAAHLAGMPLNNDSDEGYDLVQDWCRILDIYIKPGAPRELNLPAEERDDLIDYPYEPKPPPLEALEPAMKRMYDLMSDSIFIPFCNSVRGASSLQAPGFLHSEPRDPSHRASQHRASSNRRRSPPTTAPIVQRNTQQSALTSALTQSGNTRLSQYMSNSSAASEAAMSDEGGSGWSPAAADLASPPLTPPQSDIAVLSSSSPASFSKQTRSDSGGWKKLGNKIFGAKKKTSRD